MPSRMAQHASDEIVSILAIGDVVGSPGRKAIRHFLPDLCEQYELDFVIANGENAAGGFGLTVETARELLDAGVDVITSGNHIWAQREIITHLDGQMPIIRPLNYPPGVPGRGYLTIGPMMVVNLM
ncbi:MAG: YmdB family metallophosphoesterase, partial [Dehalococcoidales bacterium]|nr:YmdB family metallophosphoesterase [Dehalococcoidales bacterium]